MTSVKLIGLKTGFEKSLVEIVDSLKELNIDGAEAHRVFASLSNGNPVTIELPSDKVANLSQRFKIGTTSSDFGTKTGFLRKFKSNSSKELEEHLKMYVMIGDVAPNFAVVAASHAPLVCYWKFEENEFMQSWKKGIIFTVICKVSDSEFPGLKLEENHVVITESRLGGKEIAIAFCPRPVWPTYFKLLPLWNV